MRALRGIPALTGTATRMGIPRGPRCDLTGCLLPVASLALRLFAASAGNSKAGLDFICPIILPSLFCWISMANIAVLTETKR